MKEYLKAWSSKEDKDIAPSNSEVAFFNFTSGIRRIPKKKDG